MDRIERDDDGRHTDECRCSECLRRLGIYEEERLAESLPMGILSDEDRAIIQAAKESGE